MQTILATPSQLLDIQLLEAEISYWVKAADGEPWPKSITQDKKTFKQLLDLQTKYAKVFAVYFKDFANNRVADTIDWGKYRVELDKRARQAADFKIEVNLDVLEREKTTLLKIALGLLFDGVKVGATAGTNIYQQPADITSIIDIAEQQARKYGATLASGINATTAKRIQNSVASSLDLGEDIDAAQSRLRKIIDNPVRANMIAHTESVNAYGGGINNYGLQTDAKGKVLEVVVDNRTSAICRELHDKYGDEDKAVPVDEAFEWEAGQGGKKAAPGFHVLCRTGMYLLY